MRASGLHAPRPTILIGICALALAVGGEPDPPHLPLANGPFHSPYDVAFSPDGKLLAVSDRTAQAVWLVDMAKGNSLRSVALDGEGTGVAWAEDGGRVWVGEYGAASVAEIDPRSGAVVRRLSVGRYPKGVAVAARRGLLLVSNSGTDSVSLLDLDTGREAKRISVPREPQFIAVTRDESLALIGNLLPAGRATAADHAAVISVIDLSARVLVANVRLPPGSTAVRKIVASPDGRWAYVVHSLGRTKVPTTQLERGWVNTNALSIIDLRARTRYATVLLDHPMEGAADPWGTALSKDGKTLWVTLSGVHEVARIDMESLNRFMGGGLPDDHRL
ncbi:MAG: hypothetical protein CMJ83_17155, partial [Planctomycetes bacterium]|nr:hypothetical protein [Planctomycetota bacterium]